MDGGPPPWIPFGRPLEALIETQFKSIQDQASEDNAEFEAQRKGAIAEAQRLGSGVKKVSGFFLKFYLTICNPIFLGLKFFGVI